MLEEPVPFCAQVARESEEPLFGTATRVKVWLLLEYRKAWRRKATADNDLPAAVQEHLAAQLTAIPGSRLLFIKQQSTGPKERRFFVVRTDEAAPALHELAFSRYKELMDLDVTAVVDGDEAFIPYERREPLFLVCTNGRRDRCCAKFGSPLFKVLRHSRPENSWQSTHIGGHRYAPNVLFLPQSVNYGWLTPEEIDQAVDAHVQGQIYDLAHYRGRTYYDPPVQAADYFLRRELNLLDVNGLRLKTAEGGADDVWLVKFFVPVLNDTHEIRLRSETTGEPRLVSCGTPAMKPEVRYQFLGHRII
ncbi:MAG: sucrase ferredoxin [Candidatus Promineifilaceae bacterium]